MNLKIEETSEKLVFSIIFGAIYGLFIGLSPLGRFYSSQYCFDLGDEEFLFGSRQVVLSICAGLAFYTLTFLTINRWKGLLKTIGVSCLCLFLYAIFHIYQNILENPCFFPGKSAAVTGELLTKILIISTVITVFSTIICVPMLLIFKRILVRFFDRKDDFLKLELNTK